MMATTDTKTDDEKRQKLGELIGDIRIAMLTTVAEDGRLHSRPMASVEAKNGFDGTIWFFTYADTPKVDEITSDQQVNVSFADPKSQEYVSLAGSARLSFDRDKMAELWNPFFKAWFPKELDEPGIALLKVSVESAEYWDSPSAAIVHLYGVVKAAVTGQPPKGGENEKIDLASTDAAATA